MIFTWFSWPPIPRPYPRELFAAGRTRTGSARPQEGKISSSFAESQPQHHLKSLEHADDCL